MLDSILQTDPGCIALQGVQRSIDVGLQGGLISINALVSYPRRKKERERERERERARQRERERELVHVHEHGLNGSVSILESPKSPKPHFVCSMSQ